MGERKRLSADKRKEEQKSIAFAKLLNVPTSPRKMRLVAELYISTIYVNCAPMLKRLRTAPQGRGYRIRKRANHVTVIVDTKENN